VEAALLAQPQPTDPDLGPQVTLIGSGARGSIGQLRRLVGAGGPLGGDPFVSPIITHGLREGLPPDELFACALAARQSLQAVTARMTDAGSGLRAALLPEPAGVLVRAMGADRPGKVFAAAAVQGEVDPLTDPTVRLLMGLRPLDGAS
jgi:hypothetical protein